MQVHFSQHEDIGYECQITDAKEIPLIESKEVTPLIKSMCKEDIDELRSNLRIGGYWTFTLKELHEFVQKGVTLTGLPEWLVIK